MFRIRAYRNAAIAITEVGEDLVKLTKENRLREIPGVGKGIEAMIKEYVETGELHEYEILKKHVPKGFSDLLAIPSLGPKKVRVLANTLNITNIEDLKEAIAQGSVQTLKGFGEKTAQKILEGIAIKQQTSVDRRALGYVFSPVSNMVKRLRECPEVEQVEPAGSFRRCEETVGDIDILASGKDPVKIIEFFVKQPFVKKILVQGDTKTSILINNNVQVDLRVVHPDQYGSALQYFTGSKLHNVHLRTYAKTKGFKLSEYGFFKGETLVASKTEEECYESLGMQYVPPEIRTDNGEIEAAIAHKIPRLVDIRDIKGDLHTHSTWSDGMDSIFNMAKAAQDRGYEYIALTDHSPSLKIAHGLTVERLKEKRKEIEEMRSRLSIEILFGTEVDILPDGSIDYPDEILKQFDIVVASVHSRFNQDNTERIMKAMENPYVHIIGHPSGRLITRRPPYQLNYEKIFKKAVETNTVLEINAQHERLDLQDKYIREAIKYGCMFSIDSDAHSVPSLWLMDLGVKWARRGWAEQKHIVNTLPLDKLRVTLKNNH